MLNQHSQAAGRDVTAGKPGALGFGASADSRDQLLAKINALSVVIRALVERRDYLNLALAANQMVALQAKFEALELKLKK